MLFRLPPGKKTAKASKKQSGQHTDLREECEVMQEERDKLQRQVYQLQMEKDILEKAAIMLKKRECIDIEKLSNREKAMLVDALTGRYPIKHLLASVLS